MTQVTFEERIARYQRPGDGGYLEAHWDSYQTTRFREMAGLVLAVAEAAVKPAPGARRKVHVLEYGCSSGALFRALEHYLGQRLELSFTGVDADRRALGFVKAKVPRVALHEADPIRLAEIARERQPAADLAVVMMTFYALGPEDTARIIEALGRLAPRIIIGDQIENFAGPSAKVMALKDVSGRPYDAQCHAFRALLGKAGYAHCHALPSAEPFKSISGYVIGAREPLPDAAVLARSLAAAREDAFSAAAERRARPQAAAGPARVSAVSVTLAELMRDLMSRKPARTLVYSDSNFHQQLSQAVADAKLATDLRWVSGSFAETSHGAGTLDRGALTDCDLVVTGGALANLYHPRLLRTMGRLGVVRPVLPVADGWEFCLGQISFPAEIERAEAFLFNHFQEYFGIRDPILARLEVYDQVRNVELWRLMQPGESLRIDLNEVLPERSGPAVMSVHTVAPVLTRGRHFRWRFCIDTEWGGSIATLHGAHDIRHASAGTEFIQNRSSFGEGRIVFTLPNHYDDMTEGGILVECVDGKRRFEIKRQRTQRIEQVAVVANNGKAAEFGDYIGCRFRQYTTPYWFAFGDNGRSKTLAANHIQGQGFQFLAKEPPTKPLGALERALLDRDIVTWPYCVPVLRADSGLEVGFSFDSSWPVLKEFVVRCYGKDGRLRHRFDWTKQRPGLVYTDELLSDAGGKAAEETDLVLIAPNWLGMNLDQQANGISPIVDLALRHRLTGDYDITEFQNSWRNLGVLVESMPHWIHFSNHLLGGTNLYSRARTGAGWRVGIMLVNGSGNLRHDVAIDYVIKVFDTRGRAREHEGVIQPFTHQMIWLDDIMPDLARHLAPDGYGAIVIRSKAGDLNGQIVAIKDGRSVSLQHMWGY